MTKQIMMKKRQEVIYVTNRIKKYCDKNGITQTALAKRLGVQVNTVWRWTNGSRAPHWNDITAMCDILGCTADELMGGDTANPLIPRKVARCSQARESGSAVVA